MGPSWLHEKRAHEYEVNILQAVLSIIEMQGHPIKNQVATLGNDGQHFPPLWSQHLLLALSPPQFRTCFRKSCSEFGSESYYVETSRNLESILSKSPVLLLSFQYIFSNPLMLYSGFVQVGLDSNQPQTNSPFSCTSTAISQNGNGRLKSGLNPRSNWWVD